MTSLAKPILDDSDDWTFADVKTTKWTHGFHQYPARMHPEIAKRVIEQFANEKHHVVLDPFMGSGGVLVESILQGHNAIGIDINPLAHLISKVKSIPLKTNDLESEFAKIMIKAKRDFDKGKTYDNKPTDFNLEFWFKDDVVRKLSILKNHILNSDSKPDVIDFFKVCFSSSARKASNQRNGVYKNYRMSKEKLDNFNPDTFEIFQKTCQNNIQQMGIFEKEMKGKKAKAFPILGNSDSLPEHFKKIKSSVLDGGKAHLVMTSPPYGDHQTTVAYGQFSRDPGLWLDFPKSDLSQIDKIGLGGTKKKSKRDLESPLLEKIIKKITKLDEGRAADVQAFFDDLDTCMERISHVLKQGESHCCFVVANRTVKRIQIPMDDIIVELGQKYGFEGIQTIYRNIINKAMASKNAPENLTNKSGSTMNKESIVMLSY